ncbi:MAG: SAM-dependent methyltransferase [Verrucomicrobiales bacterium]|nr:SAM-dependent methyltransferase [Verrucomicrobiales bacterium]
MDDSNSKLLKFLKNLRKRNFRPTGGEEEKGFEGTEAADKGFEPLYKEVAPSSLPWDWPSIDPDFMDALKKYKIREGESVDLGTGTGRQPIEFAKLGFSAWGTDFSEAALKHGDMTAEIESVSVKFLLDNVCDTNLPPEKFDLVTDRGCYHVIPPIQRTKYVNSVRRILKRGGFLFLKCFSTNEPPRPGPFRFSKQEISNAFGSDFQLIEIKDTVFHGSRPVHPKAVFAVFRK